MLSLISNSLFHINCYQGIEKVLSNLLQSIFERVNSISGHPGSRTLQFGKSVRFKERRGLVSKETVVGEKKQNV